MVGWDSIRWYNGPVFVRRVLTRSKGSNHGVSYRLVHSTRIAPGKVRQVVLAYFRAGLEDRVPKSHWKLLAAQIRNLLAARRTCPSHPSPATIRNSNRPSAARPRPSCPSPASAC